MEIVFERRGFASNSSSSHSIIFINDSEYTTLKENNLVGTDRYFEFNWDSFTINDSIGKLNYIFKQLPKNHSIKFLNNNGFLDYYPIKARSIKYLRRVFKEGYVDHESVMYFPRYRKKVEEINVEFLHAFIKELLNPNYVILGGCDSYDKSRHELYQYRQKKSNDFIKIYNTLQGSYSGVLCEYDIKLDNFVLSFDNGDLFKVKF